MGAIILILVAIVICAIIPMYVKSHFEGKYNVGILMPFPIILNCVALLSILVMNLNGMEELGAIIFAIIVYVFTCIYVAMKTGKICSNRLDIVMAIVANALLPIGIALIVFMALVMIYVSSSGGKRKKR